MVRVVTGNILDAKVEALVNTVNTAGVMGKGLALQFKKAFPENWRAYEAACKRGELEVGKMFVFEAGGIVLPRYIINFPTKRHWRGPRSSSTSSSGCAIWCRCSAIARSGRSPYLPSGPGLAGWTGLTFVH